MSQEECDSPLLHIVPVDLTDWEATRFLLPNRSGEQFLWQVGTVSSSKDGRLGEQCGSCHLHPLPSSHPRGDRLVSTCLAPSTFTLKLQAVQRQREAGDQRDTVGGGQDGGREVAGSSGQCQLSSITSCSG